jgi:hypothetical protein
MTSVTAGASAACATLAPMKTLTFCAALLMLCSFADAQSKPTVPPVSTADAAPNTVKIPVPLESRDPLRSAIHKQDQDDKQISDLTSQFAQMQSQAQTKMQGLQADKEKWSKLIESEKKQAFVDAKLDPAKYDLDSETMEFSAKLPAEAKK